MANREWVYFVVTDTSDAGAAMAAADAGLDAYLLRSPRGAVHREQELWRSDGWHPSTRRLLQGSRGSYDSFLPVDVEEAQALVTRWRAQGLVTAVAAIDACVDDETDRELQRIDDLTTTRAQMASEGVAASAEIERVRRVVLDDARHFAEPWLADGGKTVVPSAFEDAPALLMDDGAGRVADGFRAVGVQRVIGLAAEPAATWDRSGTQPEGFLVEPAVASVRAFAEQHVLGGELLADEQLRCAILDVTDYVLVAGPREFVEIVLNAEIDIALDRFRARVSAAPSGSELPSIADRYLPRGNR